MQRHIVGYRRDPDEDDAWVAVLDCHHGRHLRHEPPFRDRLWVGDAEQRDARLGSPVDCLKCNRLELPDDLVVYKSTPVFDEQSLPAGLRRDHTTKAGVWARIEVLEGAVDYVVSPVASDHPETRHRLGPSRPGFVAPEHPHHLDLVGPVRLQVHFLRPPDPAPGPGSA